MELEHDPSSLPLLHFWSHAKYLNEGTEGSEELDDEAPPLDQIKIESYRHDGYTLYVVNIPMPEISPHAYAVMPR